MTTKSNLELLKEFTASVSSKYPEKLHAILAVVEKHYLANQKMVDDVMRANGSAHSARGGFSILTTNVPEFKNEILALR